MLRKILSALAGLIAAILVFMAFEWVNSLFYPLPIDLDKADHEAMAAYVKTLPTTAFLPVLAGWAAGSFVCGLLIRLISKSGNKISAYLAGLLLMTAGIVNMFTIEHPTWFIVIGLFIFVPFTLLGYHSGKSNAKG